MLGIPTHVAAEIAIPIAIGLGILHGITPDEHTWPITFSYAVGSYSSRGGRLAGLRFSLAFTLQRSLAAEIAWFAIGALPLSIRSLFAVDLIVGAVMVLSGLAVLRKRSGNTELERPAHSKLVSRLPYLHGFIAGWGVGAFAVVVYTVLVPAMPSAWIGWLPGAAFGLGTAITQSLFGGAIGSWMQRRDLSDNARTFVARQVSGRTLRGAGTAFVAIGLAGAIWPNTINGIAISLPIAVPNLDRIDAGLFLAIPAVLAVAAHSFWWALRNVPTNTTSDNPTDPGTGQPSSPVTTG